MSKTICMLVQKFPPVIGGTEQQCRILSEELAKRGNNIIIVTQKEKGAPSIEEKENIQIYRLSGFSLSLFFSFGFFLSALIFLLNNNKKYDVIHVHLLSSLTLAAIIIKILYSKKIILKLGGSGKSGDIFTSSSNFIRRLKLRFSKKYFDYFIAPSNDIFSELKKVNFPEHKILKISNGVNTDYFHPISEVEKNKNKSHEGISGKKVFLYAGRFTIGKNLIFLLRAWAKFSKKRTDVVLYMVGSGAEKRNIIKFIKAYKVANVIIKEATTEIRKYYWIADFFIFPSKAEGISNALLEAMACGLVVLASYIPANKEIITTEKNGFLFSLNNEDMLLNFLIMATKKELNTIAANARKKILNNFSISQITAEYIQNAY